jgi:hypothetical protein
MSSSGSGFIAGWAKALRRAAPQFMALRLCPSRDLAGQPMMIAPGIAWAKAQPGACAIAAAASCRPALLAFRLNRSPEKRGTAAHVYKPTSPADPGLPGRSALRQPIPQPGRII